MAVNYIPEGHSAVSPYLVVRDVRGLINFLQQVFDVESVEAAEGANGEIRHAEVRIGGSTIMMGGAQAQMAAQQCSAAVESELKTRDYGAVSAPGTARVLTITRADAEKRFVRVRGTATSGVPTIAGAVGALAATQSPTADLRFKCRIDYRGRVLELDIDRIE